jgi:hypothetical protein
LDVFGLSVAERTLIEKIGQILCSHSGEKTYKNSLVSSNVHNKHIKLFTFACLDLSSFSLFMLMIDLNQRPEPIDQNPEDWSRVNAADLQAQKVSSKK